QGMCLVDLDNDGDLDVVVNRLYAVPGIYRNETTAPRVAVRLKGQPPNTRGIGAKIWLSGGAVPMQSQEMICGGRYLASDDAIRVFAAGSLTNEMRIEVVWRSGTKSVVEQVRPNRVYEIAEAGGTAERGSVERGSVKREASATRSDAPTFRRSDALTLSRSDAPTLFAEVSGLLAHRHHDAPFDDFIRQNLLPKKLSQLGPGVAWCDVNGDGWDDLVIGSGGGGHLSIFLNNGRGGLQPAPVAVPAQAETRDQTGIIGWRRDDGKTMLLVGSANYEDGQTTGASVREYDPMSWAPQDELPATESSVGPMALGDLTGDGHLSLFVGGRVIAGRY